MKINKTFGRLSNVRKKVEGENYADTNNQYKQEAAAFGVTELEGTGYDNFSDLVTAYNRKKRELDAEKKQELENEKRYGGISSLIGKGSTLG